MPATNSAHRGSQSAVPATKSGNEPHVEKQRFTAPVTKSGLVEDHHHVQSAAPATKTAVRSKEAPIPCTCHEKSAFNHENTRFLLRLPRKVTTMCENAHGTTTRAQSLEAPAADTQIQRACAVEMHVDDLERHECIVNSRGLAGHGRALQRSKHQLLFYYRKNLLVCSHCLGKSKGKETQHLGDGPQWISRRRLPDLNLTPDLITYNATVAACEKGPDCTSQRCVRKRLASVYVKCATRCTVAVGDGSSFQDVLGQAVAR